MASRQAIVVLGMHRSGTSAMSGVLARLGCAAPKTLMPATDANERGFFESSEVYELHNAMLEDAGTCWADWQPMPKGWFTSEKAQSFKSKAREIVEREFEDAPLIVLKDPRICRLYPFWQGVMEELDIAPLPLHIHRHPLDVATSLNRHHNMPEEVALLLWLRHLLDAEAFTRGQPRHFVQYDDLLRDWSDTVSRLQAAFALTLTTPEGGEGVDTFLSPDLRHFQTPDEGGGPALSGWVGTVFEVFNRWAHGGEEPADHAILDDVSDRLASAAPFLSYVLATNEQLRGSLAAAAMDHPQLQEELSAAKGAQRHLQTDLSALKTQLLEAEAHQADLEAAKTAAETGLANALEDHAGVTASLIAEQQEHAGTQAALAAARDRASAAEHALSSKEADFSALRGDHDAVLSKLSSSEAAEAALQADLADLRLRATHEVESLKQVLSAERLARTQAQTSLADLHNSRSWRMTAPLRGVMRLLRGA